ncbi:DUF1127 domain-containing protein [Aestuariirhabdus sp. LZHN29]|uniref:DUF1127 domain-containing protein n=1 Tax=Aestuariirhabdus sp. LZHN29 TaxID=3417462 RepID=UPI003CF659B3
MNQGLCINDSCGCVAPRETSGATLSGSLIGTLTLWRERARTRRYLREMPAYLLKDIGVDESQRQQEVEKPFWR